MSVLDGLGSFGEGMSLLEGELTAKDSSAFADQFRSICSCPLAKSMQGIVYIWFSERPIPRLKGSSPIVYVGKTDQTLNARHYRYAEIEAHESNLRKYRHIIENYGPMRIACRTVDHPRESEREILKQYTDAHLELPPINASS